VESSSRARIGIHREVGEDLAAGRVHRLEENKNETAKHGVLLVMLRCVRSWHGSRARARIST
jgi:hypothetical protein